MLRPFALSLTLTIAAVSQASPFADLKFAEQASGKTSAAAGKTVGNDATRVQLKENAAKPAAKPAPKVSAQSQPAPKAGAGTESAASARFNVSDNKSGSGPIAVPVAAGKAAAPAGKSNLSAARENLLSHGKTLIGSPYKWGGMTPKGFDCSGFVSYVYQKQGYLLPRSSSDQFSKLTPVDEPQPGDLVYFRNRKSGRITHVGMYIGDGKMLHSPQSGEAVRIESMEKPNWKHRYAGARRVLPVGDKSAATQVADSQREPLFRVK